MRNKSKLSDYQHAVLDLMAETFGWDSITRRAVENTMARLGRKPIPPYFELICDDPGSANWRLKRRVDDHTKFRLADYRMPSRDGSALPEPRPLIVACVADLAVLNDAS